MSKLNSLLNKPKFNPQGLAGLKLWLDASDLSTITKDGSNNVSQWNDKSGLSHNATQATGAAQPVYTGNSINNKSVLTFTDASYMAITHNSDFNFTSGVTFFFAGDTNNVGAAARRFISKADAFAIGKGSTSTEARFTTNGIKDYDSSIGFFAANTPIIAAYILDSTYDLNFYKNGTLFETVLHDTPANTSSNDLIISSVGEPWNGRMGEILFYNRLLSAIEIKIVEIYLLRKWGVANS